jgi:hypothetical protein
MALDGSQPLWLGCCLLAKAKAKGGKSPTKGTLSLSGLLDLIQTWGHQSDK